MLRRLLVALSLLAPSGAAAQPFPVEDLPPELRPWVPWVLDQAPEAGCPRVQGRAVCVWPGRLQLELGAVGGRFELMARADRETDLRLPGDAARWPRALTLDGRAAAVFERGGMPHLRLEPGAHRVAGRFEWTRLPESIAIPPELGLVELSLDARPVPRPRREANGLLWLRSEPAEARGEAESLRLQVFRRIQDGIPLEVETRLVFEVSGRAREVELEGALLEQSQPLAVGGELPARIDAQGRLRVQLRGGRFEVRVRARLEGSPRALRRPGTSEAAWPAQEIWVFAADERLRQLELTGPAGVDPSRTELPGEWQALPAYAMGPDSELVLAERRRGQPEPPPDALTLSRELWLDPSGEAFTIRDRFGGRLGATTRLEMPAPAELGHASLGEEPQLVTGGPDASGLELRQQQLDLVAEARVPRRGDLAAVGWSADVESLQAILHLPPGWTLLAATGVDELPGTWTSRWNLMSFFFVLLVGFAALKVFGPRTAILATGALILAHAEPRTPWLVWLSLIAATGLRLVAGRGRLASLARVWWLASAGVLLLQLTPFAVEQLRVGLFPQTDEPEPRFAADGYAGGVAGGMAGGAAPAAMPAAPAEMRDQLEEIEADSPKRLARAQSYPPPPPPPPQKSGSTSFGLQQEPAQEPQAVLQTGPGVPSWQWRTYDLSWSGPVSHEHRFRLLLASPGLNLLLTLLRLSLLLLLAARLLSWPRPLRLPGLGPRVAALLGALLLAAAPARAAEPPGPQLLEELKQRLTRPAPCEPSCVSTPELRLSLRDGRLRFEAEVHAAALASWPLPGPPASWTPSSVLVDGAPSAALARLGDGFLHLRLAPGVHRVELAGPPPAADSFTLQFAQLPRSASVSAPGWDAVGFHADAPPDGSVQLARRLEAGARAREAEGEYPPWLEVTRTIQLGVSWTVTTQVRRVSPTGSPVAVRVPLLAGEAPTDAALQAENGEVAVALGRDQVFAAWSSTLERADRLSLEAPEGRPWSEVWRLQCGPIWACGASGLPPIARWSDGRLEPEYRPWPGESLSVEPAHPEGVAGPSLTIDRVELVATPGVRLETAELSLRVRTSREQPLELGLSPGAELKQLTLDGAPRDERLDASGRLRVRVPAGSHRLALTFERERGLGLVAALPEVSLPDPAVNATLSLALPASRWLLFTWGPSWGPAVLFWGYLLFVLAAAGAASRVPGSPLSLLEWLLLGAGLSQLGPVRGLFVAGFFLVMARRGRGGPRGAVAFDLAQLALVVWALVTLRLLFEAVQAGLLFRPDMQVAGGGSSDTSLRWYADRLSGGLPAAGAFSTPLWVYRATMLVWALWLAARLVRWTGWAWRCFGEGGLWRTPERPAWLRPGPRSSAQPEAAEASTEPVEAAAPPDGARPEPGAGTNPEPD